jgi:pimeloyl-ACP methyl ester carboxylesterase
LNTGAKVDAVLTLRDVSREDSTAVGNGVVVLSPPWFKLGSGDFVIFIHGFNVSQAAAREAYARFRWWLDQFQARAHILELHWPGDRKWGPVSALCYPGKIEIAEKCGGLLADWMAKQQDARFTIVAHSLGCRVAVEAVAKLRRSGHLARVLSLCLMAAAVPVRYVSNRLFGPLPGEKDPRWRILYSRGDQVLRWTFAPGQTLGWDAVFGLPVGLHGEPSAHWTATGDTWELHQESGDYVTFYDHGYYWQGGPWALKAESRPHWERWLNPIEAPRRKSFGASAELIAGSLNAPLARRIPLRQLPPPRALPERVLHGWIDALDY